VKMIEIRHNRQKGVIVLAIMLMLLAGSSYMLVKKFNANAIKARADVKTQQAMKTAKQALISYAVTYPDNVNPDEGPGYLLCPDINNDGVAGSSCSDAGNTTTGRLPFKTLELEEIRDGSGTRLWYAISENYRNNPKQVPLNSDTAGQLTVLQESGGACISPGCIQDVVAVIIAPGEPLSGQDDRGGVAENISDYLEAENANFEPFFAQSGGADFNDRITIITRDEVMAAVEKRILGDVSKTFVNYQDIYNAFPWLSPYSAPETSEFHGETSVYAGHIPFHWSNDAPGTTNRNPFNSDLTLAWLDITGADIQMTLDGTYDATDPHYFELPAPTADCVESSECNDSADAFNGDVPEQNDVADAECIWSSREIFECRGQFSIPEKISEIVYSSQRDIYGYKNGLNSTAPGLDYLYTNTSGSWQWEIAYINAIGSGYDDWPVIPLLVGDISRTYDFDMKYEDPDFDDTRIVAPNDTMVRTREPRIDSGLLVQGNINIDVTDIMRDITYFPSSAPSPSEQSTQTILSSISGTTGTIYAIGLKYDLDVDNQELPSWFVKNEWHEMIYISYPDSEDYPGTDSDQCTAGTDCISLHWIDGGGVTDVSNDIRAMALIAGKALSGQDRTGITSPPELDDYFEDDGISAICQNDGGSSICNYDTNEEYLFGHISGNFNDRISVLLQH